MLKKTDPSDAKEIAVKQVCLYTPSYFHIFAFTSDTLISGEQFLPRVCMFRE